MQKAALIFNPTSGGSKRRTRELESALEILQRGGVEAYVVSPESRAHAGEETRRAIASGCDTVFACGGDGTMHNIAQVLANSSVALAVLPMGTANALARDLGLPMNVLAATKAALNGVPRRVALGHVKYVNLKQESRSRFFVIAAGVGVDAHLFYKLHSGAKQRMGMTAYYAKAWNLWFTYDMARFSVEYETESRETKRSDVTELLAVRIRNFGGVVRELAPGASLDRQDMRLVLARTSSRLAYLAYVIRGVMGAKWSIPGVDWAYSAKATCQYAEAADPRRKIYLEADGELLGTLPAQITVVPNALTVLAPDR